MLVDTELAIAATWTPHGRQARSADLRGRDGCRHTLPAYQRVALQNVQVHGGIGYTWEHDAHLYVRRATVLQAFAGGQDRLRDHVIEMQRGGVRRGHSVDLPEEAEQYGRQPWTSRRTGEGGHRWPTGALGARRYLQPHWPKHYGRSPTASSS